ncbi:unnamed protein product, partial [Rotaria sp. Silwood1]
MKACRKWGLLILN